jgi:multicomponent Na+:H+ antiporter subunit C
VFCRHLLRKVTALNLMGSGVFLGLIALGARTPSGPPDPVPQAMVLTGIVVAVSATALMLALIRRLHRETGLTELPERNEG